MSQRMLMELSLDRIGYFALEEAIESIQPGATGLDAEMTPETAQRIRACVTVCAGIPTEALEAGVVVVPVDVVEALTLLANGCHEHPSYRAKRKVFTLCERCNAMWEARQRLSRLQQNGGEG